jgi:predicted phosphodiesterase
LSVATLYDVHGNLPALEAVLADVPDDATIVVGGDVALGPFPQQTVDLLRSLGNRVLWLRGNTDRELDRRRKGLAPPEMIEWVRTRLDDATMDFLIRLPPSVVHDGVFHCHATARNDEEIFTELTPEERVAALFADVEQDTIVCGHTHMQFDRIVAGKRVLNSGSVGMAYDEPRGAYWRLDLEPRYTPYELDVGEWPFEWRTQPRAEILAFFESIAVGA